MAVECFLKEPYVGIPDGASHSYGGSQGWFGKGVLARYGCGAVALGDVLLYLGFGEAEDTLTKEGYLHYIKKMNRLYIHVVPGFGAPGGALAASANLFFKIKKLPYRAKFCASGKKLEERVEKSIKKGFPVILAVGKSLHFFQKRKLAMYRLKKDGYTKAAEVSGHHVVVTGMKDGYFQVSSWGRKYFISIKEYLEYSGHDSSFLISNICTIDRKKKKEKKAGKKR